MPPSWHPVPACTLRLRCRRAILRCRYEIRIGRGDLCRYDRSRRNHFLLPQRKLESGAGPCRGRDRRHSGGFLLRIMPPSWHPVPACIPRLRCRRVILLCSNDGAASIPKFGSEIKNRCTQKVVFGEILASIPKSGLEIKNRCTQEGLNGEILASIPKSGLEIKNRCTLALRRRSAGGTILLCGNEE